MRKVSLFLGILAVNLVVSG
jgi:hypothetical protein